MLGGINFVMKESIKQRKSVRTFTGESIHKEHEKAIIDYLSNKDNLVGIYGNEIKIEYIALDKALTGKIGTYGIIRKSPSYLVAICKNTREALIDCGYVFEKLILFLENIGLNTCWLGGTFNRENLKLSTPIEEGEFIPVITPVGYGLGKRSLPDKMVRKFAKSDTRKDFDELFFDGDFSTSIKDSSIRETLEYVRIAPSASNKQPWRVVMDGNTAHFYIERTPKYDTMLKYDIQILDIGIALAHYELAKGGSTFKSLEGNIADSSKEYVISVN